MNSSTRLILVVLIGGGIGFGLSRLFGSALFLVLLGTAVAVAIDTGLQTRKNTTLPINPALPRQNTQINQGTTSPHPPEKPPKHTF